MATYKCALCDEEFSSTSDLANHIKDIHEGQGDSDFECTECGARFDNSQDLKQHMAASHSG